MKKIPYLIIGSLLVPQVGFSQGNDKKADKEKPNRPALERVEKQREAAEDRAKEALQAAAERLSPRNEREADNRQKPGKPEKNAERIQKQPDLRTPKPAQDNRKKPEKEADPIVQENDEQQRNQRMTEKPAPQPEKPVTEKRPEQESDPLVQETDEQQRNERMTEKAVPQQENAVIGKRPEEESDPIVQENDEPQRSARMAEGQPVPAPPVEKKADPIVTENDETNRAEKPMANSQAEPKPAMREPQEERPATATPTETPRQRAMEGQRPVATARGSDESQPARERKMQEQQKPAPTTERERPQPKEALTAETRERLEDRGRRDRATDDRKAREIKDDDDAKALIYSILGGAAAGAITSRLTDNDDRNDRNDRERDRRDFDRDRQHDGRHDPRFDPRDRLPAAQVGRSERERRETVDYLVRRLDGRANPNEAPRSFHRDRDFDGRDHDRDHRGDWNRDGHDRSHHHHPHYFNGNRRVVWFSDRRSVPAILIASNNLNQVDLTPAVRSPYRSGYVEDTPREYYEQIPATYQDEDAYALSYQVDPNSAISQDDILFKQGSTNFADAYSYDLVVDMAEAMTAPELSEAQFVIEGHASAEGSYDNNLRLSQERAERIARDLVDMGVSPDRLIPVGYGETEAEFPADAAESRRAMDRRVMVFRKL